MGVERKVEGGDSSLGTWRSGGLGTGSSLVSGVPGDLRQVILLSVALGICSLTLGTGDGSAQDRILGLRSGIQIPTQFPFTSMSLSYLAHTRQEH